MLLFPGWRRRRCVILNVAAFIYLRFVCRSLVSVLLTLYIFVNRRFPSDRMELFAGAVVLSKLHAANVAPISSRSADSDRASVWSSSLSSLFYSWMSCQSVCFQVLQLHLPAWNDQLVYIVSNCPVALASNFRKRWISSVKLAPRLMFTSVYAKIVFQVVMLIAFGINHLHAILILKNRNIS